MGQWTGTGNRCGHNPKVPRFFSPPEDDAPRPPIIYEIMERVEQVYRRPGILTTLCYHVAEKPGKERQVRSEARECAISLMLSEVYHMDAVTRRVGTLTKAKEWTGITLHDLRKGTQISGVRRCEGGSMRTVNAGLVHSREVAHTTTEGHIRGRPARRQISISFLKAIGKYGAWQQASTEAYQRGKNGGETCAERTRRLEAERTARERRLDSEGLQRQGKMELIREAVARLRSPKKSQGP